MLNPKSKEGRYLKNISSTIYRIFIINLTASNIINFIRFIISNFFLFFDIPKIPSSFCSFFFNCSTYKFLSRNVGFLNSFLCQMSKKKVALSIHSRFWTCLIIRIKIVLRFLFYSRFSVSALIILKCSLLNHFGILKFQYRISKIRWDMNLKV